MDETLKRILSLLPKKPNGSFVHGSKRDFAMSIGYDSGDVVSMWIKGTSVSYKNKLHEIAAKYNVSVEWLKGETDEKTPADPDERSARDIALEKIEDMSADELLELMAAITEKLRK